MTEYETTKKSISHVTRDARKELDRKVGARVRSLRILKGWSPQQLGDSISCTAEQIRKIERGALRVDPSKLIALATALDRPIDGFFDNIEVQPISTITAAQGVPSDFIARRDVNLLISAFADIADTGLRSSFLRVAERMAALKGDR